MKKILRRRIDWEKGEEPLLPGHYFCRLVAGDRVEYRVLWWNDIHWEGRGHGVRITHFVPIETPEGETK